jgi:sugar (pentulose or hexulose) kinase
MTIDLIIHTLGGIVLAAMQIARAVEAHKAKVTMCCRAAAPQTAGFRVLLADRITSERRCPVNDVRARARRRGLSAVDKRQQIIRAYVRLWRFELLAVAQLCWKLRS